MIRILMVDDYVDFRVAFVAMLEEQPEVEVVGQAGSLAEARRMLEGVDVALLDRGLPDGDGLELIGPLREVNPHARVLVMSSTVEMIHPTDAIEAGADGVIDKLDTPERVFAAIRKVGGG
jgi:DNA-binding NarL/FixJ family response regulator